MSAAEAERLVEGLTAMPLLEYGTEKYVSCRQAVTNRINCKSIRNSGAVWCFSRFGSEFGRVLACGWRRWVEQHHSIERLNAQAHVNARNKSDPFVLESLITFEKLPTLIKMLVSAEAWIDRIFPSVQATIPAGRSMRAYYMVRE
jgi:hypothetical protein